MFLQINIVQLELLQANTDGIGDILYIRADFGRNEELFSRYTTLLDGNAKFRFIAVHLGPIQVVVPSFDC